MLSHGVILWVQLSAFAIPIALSSVKGRGDFAIGIGIAAASAVTSQVHPAYLAVACSASAGLAGWEWARVSKLAFTRTDLGGSIDLLALLSLTGASTLASNWWPYPAVTPFLVPLAYATFRSLRPTVHRAKFTESPLSSLILISLPLTSCLTSAATLDFRGLTPALIPSSLPLGYLSPTGVGIVYDALSATAAVTSSPWFMMLAGVWFAPSLIHRALKSRDWGNRVRLSLLFTSYWVYSVYLPSFSPFSSLFPRVPYSWFNGLGTFGPVSPALFSGLLGTYAVTAVLSYLFGARQICSVTCTAPYMLQGSFQDSLKTYNRRSKIGRKNLTSRLSPLYRITSSLVWANLLVLASLSYLDQIHEARVSFLGNDPTVLATSLYFNFVWYIQFLLIPYFGNYACVTQGLCGWGTFNQLMGYLGPFRLEVEDPSLCLKCRTVDCASACPVGLTDMRASFATRGSFKAFKCVGVGDCLEACPYRNIRIRDVRAWISRRFRVERSPKSSL